MANKSIWCALVGLGVARHTSSQISINRRKVRFRGNRQCTYRCYQCRWPIRGFAIALKYEFLSDLVHISQTVPGEAPWSRWSSLGGDLKSTAPAVGRNRDGRLEVFARGTDGCLYHIWQVGQNSGWSDWAKLGGWGITDGGRTILVDVIPPRGAA
jgi:hypothetical protein